jgi:hypothetical protein
VPPISDDDMREMMTHATTYSVVLLKDGPNHTHPDRGAIVWEHGRRNFELRAAGVLAIVCPITDDSEWCGIGIFAADPAEVARVMDGDPGVEAGIFSYEVHPVRSFPGDALPPPAASGVHE